jgi:hypothetical protein
MSQFSRERWRGQSLHYFLYYLLRNVFQNPRYRPIIAISGENRKTECDGKQLGYCADVESMTGDCVIRESVFSSDYV